MAHRLFAPVAAILLLLMGALTLAVAGCSSHDNAANAVNVDENLTTAEMNAVDRNAVDTNGMGNGLAPATNAVATGSLPSASANNAEVQPGKGNFTKPPAMEVGSWYTIEFHAGPNEQALADQAQGAQTTASEPIHISRHMKVMLQPDPNFLIRTKSEADQDTGADWAATWDWDVKPVSEGVHTLIAHVEVMMHDNNGKLVHYDQYDSRVAVQVSVGSWQGLLNGLSNAKNLGDALTTLFQSWRGTLLALAGLISAAFGVRWAIRRGRKSPPDDGEGG